MTTLADGTEDEVGESELPLSSDCVWASPSELNIAGSHPVAYTTVHNGCSGSVCFKCFKTAGTFGVTVSMGLIGTFSMYGAGAPHEHDLIYPVCLDQDGKLSLGFDVSKSQEPKGWFALWPCGVDSPVLVTGTYVRP